MHKNNNSVPNSTSLALSCPGTPLPLMVFLSLILVSCIYQSCSHISEGSSRHPCHTLCCIFQTCIWDCQSKTGHSDNQSRRSTVASVASCIYQCCSHISKGSSRHPCHTLCCIFQSCIWDCQSKTGHSDNQSRRSTVASVASCIYQCCSHISEGSSCHPSHTLCCIFQTCIWDCQSKTGHSDNQSCRRIAATVLREVR
jgi:hypothetical protein